LSVFNADSYFSATATLLLYLDPGSTQITGQLTSHNIGSQPNSSVNENLQTDSSGNITGTVTTTSSRQFDIAGFVNTSKGRIDTHAHQSINFSNIQNFSITASAYVQDIAQQTNVNSTTITRQGVQQFATIETFRYPLTVDLALNFNSDGSGAQSTTVSQEFKNDLLSPFFASFIDNKVNSTDTLDFGSSFHITGNTGAQSSQTYSAFNTGGQAYSCTLKSQDNALTSVGSGCTSR
jgi:hypothetical protein